MVGSPAFVRHWRKPALLTFFLEVRIPPPQKKGRKGNKTQFHIFIKLCICLPVSAVYLAFCQIYFSKTFNLIEKINAKKIN